MVAPLQSPRCQYKTFLHSRARGEESPGARSGKLSQALHTHRRRLVDTIRTLRDSPRPLLRNLVGMAVADFRGSHLPSYLRLALLQLALLLGAYASWTRVCAMALLVVLVLATALWLLDKRVLRYERWISDEALVASLVLMGLACVLTFVLLVMSVQARCARGNLST